MYDNAIGYTHTNIIVLFFPECLKTSQMFHHLYMCLIGVYTEGFQKANLALYKFIDCE